MDIFPPEKEFVCMRYIMQTHWNAVITQLQLKKIKTWMDEVI